MIWAITWNMKSEQAWSRGLVSNMMALPSLYSHEIMISLLSGTSNRPQHCIGNCLGFRVRGVLTQFEVCTAAHPTFYLKNLI